MEIRLGTLIESQGALSILNQQRGLNSLTAYRIAKNVKTVTEELKTYDEHRINLCKEYANKDEDGKPVVTKDEKYDIPEESFEKYVEDLKELHEEMVEVSIRKVRLEDIDAAGLSPAQLETVEFMLELDEE